MAIGLLSAVLILAGSGSVASHESAGGSAIQPRISFLNDVEPILTRAGCNAGACHGAQFGKGGFKLSLAAYDPDLDYDAIARLQGGRRVNRTDPTNSLFLKKPTLTLPHQGGQRIVPSSADYWSLVRWIQQGAPGPNPKDPFCLSIRVIPDRQIMKPGNSIRLRLLASYSDGTVRDVTAHTRINALNDSVAAATPEGIVTARSSGASAVMLRFAGLATVSYIDVPFSASVNRQASNLNHAWSIRHSTEGSMLNARRSEPEGYIDRLVAKRWTALGLSPSSVCTDAEFLRRASLDVVGTLPTPEEVRRFLSDRDPRKRERLVDSLLDRPEYVDYWSLKWADLLRSTRTGIGARGQTALNHWIRTSLAENMPYDQMVRELLTAQGSSVAVGPANYFRATSNPQELGETTAELFLGVRLQCARCHHHPFEKWSQRDYFQFAAYFARIGTSPGTTPDVEQIVRPRPAGEVTHPKTGEQMNPTPLMFDERPSSRSRSIQPPSTSTIKSTNMSSPLTISPSHPLTLSSSQADRRESLAAWLTGRENRPFARMIVNRYWAALMGRGIVHPVDDVRVTNPPSNPELLDALATDFVNHGFDLKHLIRTICTSRVYQLSSASTALNRADEVFYTHRMARRQPAEVLLDSVCRAAGATEKFAGLPAGIRAIQLPDSGVASMFLDTFGRPPRTTSCECERAAEPSLSQALQMLNSEVINRLICSPNGRTSRLVTEGKSDRDIVDELYLASLSRLPRESERRTALLAVARARSRQQAAEDLLWALLNTNEFSTVR